MLLLLPAAMLLTGLALTSCEKEVCTDDPDALTRSVADSAEAADSTRAGGISITINDEWDGEIHVNY